MEQTPLSWARERPDAVEPPPGSAGAPSPAALSMETVDVHEYLVSGVGWLRIPSTGETVGQYGYDLAFEPGVEMPTSTVVDLPVVVATRCLSAGLTLELEPEDGLSVTLMVTGIGPGGADVIAVDGPTGAEP